VRSKSCTESMTARHGVFPNGLAGSLARFLLRIAPLGNRFASLNEPVEFAVNAPGKFASAFATATGGEGM